MINRHQPQKADHRPRANRQHQTLGCCGTRDLPLTPSRDKDRLVTETGYRSLQGVSALRCSAESQQVSARAEAPAKPSSSYVVRVSPPRIQQRRSYGDRATQPSGMWLGLRAGIAVFPLPIRTTIRRALELVRRIGGHIGAYLPRRSIEPVTKFSKRGRS